MTTLAIVSSYSESCGNAAFTRVLHDTIESYSDTQVEVIELNLKLLQSTNRKIRQLANAHVADICQRLKTFDAVNVQMESGLYGTIPHDIIQRVKKIIDANPNTSVTLHAPRLITSSSMSMRSGLKKILHFNIKAGLKEIMTHGLAGIHIRINKKIINHAIMRKRRLIVHTLRAREQIQQFFDYHNIDVHPLKIVPENFQPNTSLFTHIKKNLALSPDDISIGMFGYISAYKGFADGLEAMKSLPAHYKLFIFGRQHPQTLKSDGQIDGYLNSLIKTVAMNKTLKNRVFFLGELSDEEFLQVANSVDIAWLPYYENGQDGSGIAAICFDVCQRVLCSTSFAFDELFKLIPYRNCRRFDIGNALEIATKTQLILKEEPQITLEADLTKYTIRSQAQTYLKNLS